MPEDLKVIGYSEKTDGQSMYYECVMSDRSIWTCDTNLENWKKASPNLGELQQAFINSQRKQS